MMNWKGFGKSGHDLIKVLLQHFPGGTEGNNEKQPVSQLGFESNTSQIQVYLWKHYSDF
jgi:hypothetical protein